MKNYIQSEVKQVQIELEHTLKEKNRLLAAVETVTNGIGIIKDHKFVYLNQAHVEMFGYGQPEELLGQSWHTLYDQKYVAQIADKIFPILRDRGKWQGTVKAKHLDGHTFDVELTLTLTETRDLICVCQNISEHLEIERSLIESDQEQLEESNCAQDNFIAHMSHELRTPLNSILGFSNILKRDSSLSKEQRKALNIINQSGQHLLTLINNILNLSRLTASKPELKHHEEVSPSSLPAIVQNYDNRGDRYLITPCKILVIDDHQENRLLLAHYLQSLGFTVKKADNAQEGIAIALEFQPDVILLDLLMPVTNGKEIIERIRQDACLKDTIILLISAKSKAFGDSSALDQRSKITPSLYETVVSNCDGFLAQPVDLDELLKLIEAHLQLDWRVSPTDSQSDSDNIYAEAIVPSEQELNNLLKLVNFGKMKELLRQIDLLVQAEPQYIPFAKSIRYLAENCQQERLQESLAKLLE